MNPQAPSKGSLFSLLFLLVLPASAALAAEVTPQENSSIPCAVISRIAGEVEIFDSSRTHLLEATVKAGVPCGGWVATKQAWVELKHRDGFTIHVGSQSFVQFPESNTDGKQSGDHAVVYKGEVFGKAGGGSGELRITTANARARVSRGSVMVTFTQDTEESQLTTLESTATLENIFEITRKITARAGEATSLNLKLLRVVPSAPKAVSVSSLRPKLVDLHLDEGEQALAIEASLKRADRRLASQLINSETGQPLAKASRAPASAQQATYVRHHTDKQDAELREHFQKKMVAGTVDGERILFPDRFYGRPQKVHLQIVDVDAAASKHAGYRPRSEDLEKKRLIEELSKIREE